MGVTRVRKSKKKAEATDDVAQSLYTHVETLKLKDGQGATATTTTGPEFVQSAPSTAPTSISTLSSPLPSLSSSPSISLSPTIPQSKFEAKSAVPLIDFEHLEQFEPPIEVRPTTTKGLAVFATRKIPAGSLVLAERPLIRLTQAEEDSDKDQSHSVEGQDDNDDEEDSPLTVQFQSLPKPTQKSYLKLYDSEKSSFSRIKSIYYSNCYNLSLSPTFPPHRSKTVSKHAETTAHGPGGGSCIGLSASRLNHSCIPNVQFSFSEPHNLMLFHAIKPIPRGREVLSNYDTVFAVHAQRRKSQLMYYGFECGCEACVPQSAFWEKSDERRRAMVEMKKQVSTCERNWNEGLNGDKEQEQERTRVCTEACDALLNLESLLIKEGLLGLTLADTYQALWRWADRMGDEAKANMWRDRECEVSIVCFGEQSSRVQRLKSLRSF